MGRRGEVTRRSAIVGAAGLAAAGAVAAREFDAYKVDNQPPSYRVAPLTETSTEPREARVLWRGPAVGKGVALTFDDGPDARWTPRLLDRLANHEVRVTFFMLGRSVRRHPEIARRVAEAGHEIGTHGWTHRDMTRLGLPELTEQLKQTHAQIRDVTGQVPVLLRPPYGRFDAQVVYAATELGYNIPLWSHSLPGKGAASAARGIARHASPGMIVLSHDGRSRASEDGLDGADRLIIDLKAGGFTFQTVTTMLTPSPRVT